MKVVSVNISEKKGTIKKPVDSIQLTDLGVAGDAHAGSWHRQVSLLGKESVEKFEKEAGREIEFGEFAENITTEGLLLYKTSPLDRLKFDDIELEVTQIGKKCHGTSCAIFREVGNCVMPKEGVFARVITPGSLKAGATFEYFPKVYKVEVITLSDRASKGEYEDRSGPRIIDRLTEYFNSRNQKFEIDHTIIPDDAQALESLFAKAVSENKDAIFTTGGTGVGLRDITPEVVQSVLEKEIPGIMEAIRLKYGLEKPNALLSRGVAGTIGKTQVYTLPGSVKAVNEYLDEILKTFHHLVLMIHSIDAH